MTMETGTLVPVTENTQMQRLHAKNFPLESMGKSAILKLLLKLVGREYHDYLDYLSNKEQRAELKESQCEIWQATLGAREEVLENMRNALSEEKDRLELEVAKSKRVIAETQVQLSELVAVRDRLTEDIRLIRLDLSESSSRLVALIEIERQQVASREAMRAELAASILEFTKEIAELIKKVDTASISEDLKGIKRILEEDNRLLWHGRTP